MKSTLTDSGGGRLVDDTKNSKTGNSTGILGSRSLSIIEIYSHVRKKAYKVYTLLLTSRNSNNGVSNLVAEVGLSGLLHLGQDHGGYFLRGLFRMSAK